jgi:hypothetical protein
MAISPGVARELYPIALQQARRAVLVDLAAVVIIALGAVAMWVSGWPAVWCFLGSAVIGGPAVWRGIQRWRRLKNMRAGEAAERGEL